MQVRRSLAFHRRDLTTGWVAAIPVVLGLLLGAGEYGLTQLRNLARLPVTGAVVVAGPLPIVGGSGSPCRALALVERS